MKNKRIQIIIGVINGKGTDTPDPNQEQCAILFAWIPPWNICIFPVGGCGGIRSWPDPVCK